MLHSRLSPGERFDEWKRIRTGQVKIAVGARSCVFAPFENLGLIVIDEEHEGSYHSDKTPRYDAYDVALQRCRAGGGALLLGSATPSVETYWRMRRGELELLRLPHRINGRPLPHVEVVDMREELAQGNRSMFSSALYRELKRCFQEGRQAILFLNRRGYSTFVSCRGCGHVLRCSHCDVSLTYHKTDRTVRCHYCGESRVVPDVCPECGKPFLKFFGVGTQQVEESVNRYFPGIRVLRMDYDTTQKKDAHLEILGKFAAREADVLIGTQMIAKGLDFPQVTLVGVIAADSTLFVPDYRSAERAFQLITQVAGRAGRDEAAGRVIVQTYSPEHPSIRFAARQDYEGFYDYEIHCREQNEFPPFADFVRFLFAGDQDEALAGLARIFREELENLILRFLEERGLERQTLLYIANTPAPLHFLRGEFRHQVILKLRRTEASEEILQLVGAFARAKRQEGVCPNMEINPQNMI